MIENRALLSLTPLSFANFSRAFLLYKIMSKQTYFEKLKDPRWQRKRLEIMERDDFTCVSCGNKEKTLNVHHKTYRKGAEPWDYEDENFVTYCVDCHGEIHSEKDFLMMNIDTLWRLKLIDDMACFCEDEQIYMSQLLALIGAMKKGQPIHLSSYKKNLKIAFYIFKSIV